MDGFLYFMQYPSVLRQTILNFSINKIQTKFNQQN